MSKNDYVAVATSVNIMHPFQHPDTPGLVLGIGDIINLLPLPRMKKYIFFLIFENIGEEQACKSDLCSTAHCNQTNRLFKRPYGDKPSLLFPFPFPEDAVIVSK